jgi:hypothetical protein
LESILTRCLACGAKSQLISVPSQAVVSKPFITGAALEVMDQASIPKHFNLVVP